MKERAIVVIDAGHGGSDPGAVHNARVEKYDALNLALAVGKILTEKGVDVRYTRTDDTYNTPLEKAMMANEAEADYFVSIHRNAMPIPGAASGVESLTFENKGIPGQLAQNINKNLENVGFTNLGIQERPGLVVLRRTKMPAVLVEAGFIDNEADNQFFDWNFPVIASAIANGILTTIKEQEIKNPEYYQIQTGAYQVRPLAEQQLATLKAQGFPAFIVLEDNMYKVRVGAFRNLDNAARVEKELKQYGYNTLLVKKAPKL